MSVYTDIADEIYGPSKGQVPGGVKLFTARSGPITLTRVQITRPGLERPAGRYSTLEIPSLAVVDNKDERYVSAVAGELRAMLPETGSVLVVGVGNRRVTADALGPRAAGGVLVTRGIAPDSRTAELGLREVCCVSPGASGETGIPLVQVLAGLVRAVGLSNFSGEEYLGFLKHCRVTPAVDQVEAHVYHPQLELKELLAENGTCMQAWSSFTQGVRNIFADPVLAEAGRRHGKTAAQVALRYLVEKGIPVLPRSARREHMRENLDIFDFRLTDGDRRAIAALDEGRSLFGWF